VIVMGTSLSRETLPEAWRAGEGMSSGKEAPGVLRGVSTIYQHDFEGLAGAASNCRQAPHVITAYSAIH
jgi:hypothetical protein